MTDVDFYSQAYSEVIKIGRMKKTIGICGLAVVAVFTFAGCAGFSGDDKEVETAK